MQGLEPCACPILEYETDIVAVSKEYYPFFFNRTESANSKKSYLAVGYLKCGIWAQKAENKPLPFRYLLSYIKNVTTR